MLYADAHLHSNPVEGLGARLIAKRFRDNGGWFIALVGLSPWHYGLRVQHGFEEYVKAIEIHVRECKAAKEEGLRVACLSGFHPADVDKLVSQGMEQYRVLELGEKIIKHLSLLCRKGVIDGIGEVGRQHYRSMPSRISIAEYIAIRAIEEARDQDCIVHLHLENEGLVTVKTMDKLIKLVGGRRETILFHHASLVVARESIRKGYYASVPGRRKVLSEVIRGPLDNILVESDFIDDPRRPCVAQCPWDVVRVFEELIKNGVSEDVVAKLNIDNIVNFYGVEPP